MHQHKNLNNNNDNYDDNNKNNRYSQIHMILYSNNDL